MSDSRRWTVGEVRERAAAGDPEALRLEAEFAQVVVDGLAPLFDGGNPPRLRNPAMEHIRAIEAAETERARVQAADKRSALRRERMMLALTAVASITAVLSVVLAATG